MLVYFRPKKRRLRSRLPIANKNARFLEPHKRAEEGGAMDFAIIKTPAGNRPNVAMRLLP
jgi:hypothetical protein